MRRRRTILLAEARQRKGRGRLRSAEDLWRDVTLSEALPHEERVAATRVLFAEAEVLYAKASENCEALRTVWERLGRALRGEPKK